MPVVFGMLRDPTGHPSPGRIIVRLPAPVWDDEGTRLQSVTIPTSEDGAWQADLPAGTYEITHIRLGHPSITVHITVPGTAGPHWDGDLLDDPPAAPGSSALAAHAADEAEHTGQVVGHAIRAGNLSTTGNIASPTVIPDMVVEVPPQARPHRVRWQAVNRTENSNTGDAVVVYPVLDGVIGPTIDGVTRNRSLPPGAFPAWWEVIVPPSEEAHTWGAAFSTFLAGEATIFGGDELTVERL